MQDRELIEQEIYSLISNLLGHDSVAISGDALLIGGESVLDSMKLVELCIALQKKC